MSKHSLADSRDNQGIVMGPDHFWKLLSHPKANHLHTFLPKAPPLSPSSLLSLCALYREPLFLARTKPPYLHSPSGTGQLFLYTFPLGDKITLTVLLPQQKNLTSMGPVLMTTYCVPGTRTQTMDGSLLSSGKILEKEIALPETIIRSLSKHSRNSDGVRVAGGMSGPYHKQGDPRGLPSARELDICHMIRQDKM